MRSSDTITVRAILQAVLLEDRATVALGSRIRERFAGIAADDVAFPRSTDRPRAIDPWTAA
ncbi:hypothetical protein [Patulibacter defluvii]|uniref:hypothetical protein n=1 Tax=Patulibacter defluvii TaxID=3095358 RepID=UPI002A7477E9|nr:hypothetical protein [Patulibacter sp. DM4]